MRTAILILCVGIFSLLSGTPFTMATGEKDAQKPEPAKLESLEALQAKALQNDLDIKIAEAKLRVAQLELERTQMKLKSRLAKLHGDLKDALAEEKVAVNRYLRTEDLFKRGGESREVRDAAFLAFAKIRDDRRAIEKKLTDLVSGVPGEPEIEK